MRATLGSSRGCLRLASALAALTMAVSGASAGGQDSATARRLLERASELLATGDAPAAVDELQVLFEQFGSSDVAPEAMVLLARAQNESGLLDAAIETARRLVEEHPRSPSGAGGMVLQATFELRTATSLADLEDLRDRLARVALLYPTGTYPRLVWRPAASVLGGEIELRLNNADSAASRFAAALEPWAEPRWRARAMVGLGRALLAENEWEAAAHMLQRGLAEEPFAASTAAAQARALLALVHRRHLRTQTGGRPWISTRSITRAGAVLERPIGIAASLTGELLVADEGVPFVSYLAADESPIASKNSMPDAAHPWFGPDGTPLVALERSIRAPFGSDRSVYYAPDGGSSKPLEKIVAAAEDPFGGRIVAYDDGNRVARFHADGNSAGMVFGGQRVQIRDIVAQGADFLLLDGREKRLYRLGPQGAAQTVVSSGSWRRPEAVDIDLLGNLYVLDRDEGRIYVYKPDGTQLEQSGPDLPGGGRLDDPRDLAVDGAGRLFVADRGAKKIWVVE